MSVGSRAEGFWLAVILFFVTVSVAFAHHSYVTKYDPKKLVKLNGVVGSVSYSNPHIYFDFIAASKHANTTWRIETESIPKARAKGLSPKYLKSGASATVVGWMSRANTAELGLKSIQFKSGRSITMRGTAR